MSGLVDPLTGKEYSGRFRCETCGYFTLKPEKKKGRKIPKCGSYYYSGGSLIHFSDAVDPRKINNLGDCCSWKVRETGTHEEGGKGASSMTPEAELFLTNAAYDDMGIYPNGQMAADGTVTPRTPWQDGWNAALMALTKKQIALGQWWKLLPEDSQKDILTLLKAKELSLSEQGGRVSTWILVSDTFAYACADAESITIDEIPKALKLYQEFGWTGLVAWVSNKRGGCEPLNKELHGRFQEALEAARKEKGKNSYYTSETLSGPPGNKVVGTPSDPRGRTCPLAPELKETEHGNTCSQSRPQSFPGYVGWAENL